MSFFKDFKEDLSQAVNELMPEESSGRQSAEPSMDDIMASLNLGSDNEGTDGMDNLPGRTETTDKGNDPSFDNLFSAPESNPDPVNIDVIPDEPSDNQMVSSGSENVYGQADTTLNFDAVQEPVSAAATPAADSVFAQPEAVSAAGVSQPVQAPVSEPVPQQPVYTAPPAPEPPQYSAPAPQPAAYSAPAPQPAAYGAPASQAPAYGTAAQTPSYGAPASQAPAYGSPVAQTSYSAPASQAHTYTAQAPQTQAYSAPAPRKPVEPVFKETAHRAPINTTGTRTSKETGLIINNMSVTGDIISEGNLEIMGSVKGNIKLDGKLKVSGQIEGNSDVEELFADNAKITGDLRAAGAVKIGHGSVVKGNINATSGVIAGAVKGDIDIVGPVILDSTAIIMGNIKSRTLQINNGAVIEGLCSQCYAEVNPMSFFEKE